MYPYGSEQEHDPYLSHDEQFAREQQAERFLPPTDKDVDEELERRDIERAAGETT